MVYWRHVVWLLVEIGIIVGCLLVGTWFAIAAIAIAAGLFTYHEEEASDETRDHSTRL